MNRQRTLLPVMAVLVLLGSMCGSQVLADVPTYSLQTILDSPGCTSVDVSPDGARLYARIAYGGWDEGYRVFDANTYAALWDYRPGQYVNSAPWRGLVSSDSNYLYMSTYYDGAVKKIEVIPETGHEVASLPVGSWPFGMAFDSERRFLYAEQGCPGTGVEGSIQVYDTMTQPPQPPLWQGSVPLNGEPVGTIVGPGDQYVYVMSRTPSAHTMYKIRTSDLHEAGTFSMSASSIDEAGGGFSLTPDGNTLYVPDSSGNSVHVLSTSDMSEIEEPWILPGVDGFYVSPTGSHALVVESGTQTLRVFDLSSKAVVQTLNVDTPLDGRWTPFWDLDGGRVYIAGDDGVAVLVPEPATLSLLALGGLALIRRRRK